MHQMKKNESVVAKKSPKVPHEPTQVLKRYLYVVNLQDIKKSAQQYNRERANSDPFLSYHDQSFLHHDIKRSRHIHMCDRAPTTCVMKVLS